MESTAEFLRVLQHAQSLSTAHRQLRMRLAHSAQLSDDVLLPQRVVGTEAICGGIDYRVACVAGTPALPLKELIALPAEIQAVTLHGKGQRMPHAVAPRTERAVEEDPAA